jgi:hypothetical protein
MEPIPNEREGVAHHAADEERDDNQRGRSEKFERPNRQLQMDHVRPQYEIIERLSPIQRYEKRPNHMPPAKKHSDRKCRFGWAKMLHRRFPFAKPMTLPSSSVYLEPDTARLPPIA